MRNRPPITYNGTLQLPVICNSHVTISGLSTELSAPEVFIAALTTPAWLPPMSRHVLHDAPSVNMLAATATAISVAASRGSCTSPARSIAPPASTYAIAPRPQRPTRNPNRRVTTSVAMPPNKSPATLKINGSPAKKPSWIASKWCFSFK